MNFFTKRLVTVAIALIGLTTLAVCSVIVLLLALGNSGGIPSSYRAIDHDPKLTPIAREAIPIIKLIDLYYKAHGHCPRVSETDSSELRNSLPGDFVVTFRGSDIELRAAKVITGWSYYSDDSRPATCQLSHKLGWDADLVWRRHEDQTEWIFAPGDGSEDTAIDLDVGR